MDIVDTLKLSKIMPSLIRAGMILLLKRNLGTEHGRSRQLINRRTHVMKLIMNSEGRNDFKMLHTRKCRRIRNGESGEDVYCTEEDVAKARIFFSSHEI